jgi:Zn-dependent protease
MSTFYEIDSTHVSFKEYWWGTQSPAVLIGWLVKLTKTRIPSSADDPNTDSTLPFVVEQLPPEVSAAFAPLAAQLAAAGFSDPVYHLIHDAGTSTTIYWATYRHSSGNYFARIHQRIWKKTSKTNRGLFPMFFTEFADGTFLVSSSGKPDMAAPASIAMNRMPRASCGALWQKHTALTEQRAREKSIVPVTSSADLVAATERHHILTRDFHLARGVFRVRNAAEQAKADALEQAQASGLQNPEVMAELDKLQEAKPAWRGTIWLLVGSIVLFLVIGAANWKWDWKFTLWLLAALFFHEAGHWIAMRIFKYRNLRMFFIPLFGAAVTGQHWNVSGWKKALVSLAGPLPGIALGFVVGIAGIVTHRDALLQAAILLIFLNGYNLLPFLPLDGGHFMQSILFCRNRWLDAGFRVLAIAGMAGLAALGMGRFLVYLIIPMAIYLPVAFQLGKVTDSLRRKNLPPPAPGQERIPADTAQAIISEVTVALPKNLSSKATAQHSLTVFENLNARPPGVLATIALLVLYGGGVFIAVIAGLTFIVAKQGKLGDFLRAAAMQPQYTFACGSAQSWHGSEALTNHSPHNVIVTTLATAPEAKSAFASLTEQLPKTGQLMLFGQSLLVTLPCSDDAAREEWFDRLQTMSTNSFVAISNQPVTFNLNFIAPTETEATNLEHALTDFFNSNVGVRLIPPWSPEAKSAKFTAYEHERRMWRQIYTELGKTWTNAELQALGRKIAAAQKRGSVTEAASLQKEREKAFSDMNAATVERLRTNPDFDPQLVELHSQLTALSHTNRAERARINREVGVKLGAEPADEESSSPSSFDYSGIVRRNGLLFQVNWFTMSNPSKGLPTLTDWLCEHRCIGIRYEFVGGLDFNLEDLEE